MASKAFAKLKEQLPDDSEAALLQGVDAFLVIRDRQVKSGTASVAFKAWQAATVPMTRSRKPTSDKC